MTKLLEQAIRKIRELPEDEQDLAATELLGYLADFPTADERVAIAAGQKASARDEVVTLEQWRYDMGLSDH